MFMKGGIHGTTLHGIMEIIGGFFEDSPEIIWSAGKNAFVFAGSDG